MRHGRLGVDIGGTFTDVALEIRGRCYSAKILTTPEAPERAVLEAMHVVLREAALAPADLSIIIHGTTLATNAIIERKGAKTALLTTEGFRDTIEIRHENRFEQYDVNIDLPPPLVPRRLRIPVRERVDAKGNVLVPLDEDTMLASVRRLLELHPARRLGVAGGIFANVRLNRTLAEQLPIDEIFIFPPMGDEGLPVGGALSYLLQRDGIKRWLDQRRRLDNVYFGRDYTAQAVLNIYETFHRGDGKTIKLAPDRGEGQH